VTTIARDEPKRAAKAILALAHGAGGDLNDPLLVGVGRVLAARDVSVVRFNFPYRDAGRRAPGAQGASEEAYRLVASEARQNGTPLFCGGKSYGGRIASHIAADGFDVAGLVFLSYPLHAPGRPDRLRDEHLSAIAAPMLFVQGTNDPFAKPDLLRATLAMLPSAHLVPVDGGDHSLRVRGRKPVDLYADVANAIEEFIATS
jgi:predicted alpha/beta-hydrolase family hydrolase